MRQIYRKEQNLMLIVQVQSTFVSVTATLADLSLGVR